jgi:stage III sporulation protein SpoIIIAA
VVARIGSFGEDNRAGIERTLHRISAIRNRRGRVVGLTCRVGRAVFGTIKVIEDLVQSGKSVLLLGRPGVGKTTMLREVARVLADDMKKRVIIVDTSNEIAGDGDIPHPAIGHARRMQVATPTLQHAVMIEAVENHMPEVIVIDEIGTELEALAARTIAERGVQLVGTAHGNSLDNLMMNPTLADLAGGIQSVTLGDDEARRRGTQKSILERRSPPTFDIVVEIQDWDKVSLHPDVGEAVDALLRGQPPATEVRWLDENGEVNIEKTEPEVSVKPTRGKRAAAKEKPKKLYLFGVNRVRLAQIAREMGVELETADRLSEATMFVTSKNYYRHKPQKVRDAESAGLPVYVLRSNTPPQMRHLLGSVYPLAAAEKSESFKLAISEVQEAVEQVQAGEETVELSPQSAYIRRLQHLIAQRNDLESHSFGKDPQRRVRIFKEQS